MTIRLASLCALLALAAACGESVDTTGLEPIDDYGSWAYHDEYGHVPGHGESWRAIFINPVARGYAGAGRYPVGSVIVKEIRSLRDEGGQPAAGGLRYIAIMRKIDPAAPPAGVPVDGGWVFTMADELGAEETHLPLCWATCHRQAPIDGAFLDYGVVGTDP